MYHNTNATKYDCKEDFHTATKPCTVQLAAGWSDSSSTGSQSGSESDTGSETDSSSRGGARDTASAVRLAALSCLQQLAKADGKALHPFWIMLLPVYNPLQTKYHDATLMDAVVRDPMPKVTVLHGSLGLIQDMGSQCRCILAVQTWFFRCFVGGLLPCLHWYSCYKDKPTWHASLCPHATCKHVDSPCYTVRDTFRLTSVNACINCYHKHGEPARHS